LVITTDTRTGGGLVTAASSIAIAFADAGANALTR
jgi:hypothetical protein